MMSVSGVATGILGQTVQKPGDNGHVRVVACSYMHLDSEEDNNNYCPSH